MTELIKLITKELKKVIGQCYYSMNQSQKVIYPYLTFTVDVESLEQSRDGVYIDIDLFDANSSFGNLFELEQKIKDHFTKLYTLEEFAYTRFSFEGSNNIQTLDDNLKRRNVRLYCKVDWRS